MATKLKRTHKIGTEFSGEIKILGRSLGNDFQSGTTLDLVASTLGLNHDATLRRIARASTTMDQESRATTHVVGG